jgi:hypothetical protein
LEHVKKMDCAHVSELLSPYIDEMLDAPQAQALRSHLETCAVCEAERALLARMREALLSIPEPPLPADFDERLRRALASAAEASPFDSESRTDGTRARSRRAGRQRLAAVAAVFAIGTLSLFAYNNIGEAHLNFTPASSGVAEDATIVASAEESSDAGDEETSVAAPKENAPTDAGAGDAEETFSEEGIADDRAGIVDLTRIFADNAERPAEYGHYESSGYLARGTTTGAHRLNEKAVCDEMLKDKLKGWTYEILREEKRDDAYVYRVNVIRNESGMEFNQEIEIVASGDGLRIYYASEFMGL